jgi:hypothetical protein
VCGNHDGHPARFKICSNCILLRSVDIYNQYNYHMSVQKHNKQELWRLRLDASKHYYGKNHFSAFMYETKKEAADDSHLYRWYFTKTSYMSESEKRFSKPCGGKFDWKEKPSGTEWRAVQEAKPWRQFNEDSSCKLVVAGAEIQSLGMHKPFNEYGETKKRAITSAFGLVVETAWSAMSGGRHEDLGYVLSSKYGSDLKKTKTSCTEINASTMSAIGTAIVAADGRNDAKTPVQLMSLMIGNGCTRADLAAACPQAHISPRQFTAAKQNAMFNGPGNPVPDREPTRRNISYKWAVTEKLVRFCIREGSTTASARSIRTDVGEIISIPTLYRKETVNHLVDKFIRQEEILRGISEEANERSKQGERKYISLKRKAMVTTVKAICPQRLKCLAALDAVSEVCGRCVYIYKYIRHFN